MLENVKTGIFARGGGEYFCDRIIFGEEAESGLK